MDNLTLRSVQIHPIWCSVTPSIDWAEGARMVVTRMIPVMVVVMIMVVVVVAVMFMVMLERVTRPKDGDDYGDVER